MSLKSESSKKGDMSEKLTLSFLTKFIKCYNGDRESLPAFITNCENAMSLASPEQQSILCKFVISQLDGKAQVICSLKKFSNWDELKSFLRTTFGEKKHATHLLSDLQHSKQQPNEDVTKYSLRVESILTKIQSDIHYSCKDEKELPGRIAGMEELALNSFLLGLSPSISTIVRCKNPTTLNDAVQYATDEEKLYNSSKNNNTRPQKQCTVCHKFGHNSSECFKNRKPNSNIRQSFHVHSNSNPNPNFNTNFNNQYSNFNNKSCNYCKNLGHTINECRKRKFNMQRQQNADGAHRDNSAPARTCDFENVNSCEPDEDNDNLN